MSTVASAGELVLAGRVRGADGAPVPGAELVVWPADAHALHAGSSASRSRSAFRVVVRTDHEGAYVARTSRRRLHVQVRADGHRTVTALICLAPDGGTGVARATYDVRLVRRS